MESAFGVDHGEVSKRTVPNAQMKALKAITRRNLVRSGKLKLDPNFKPGQTRAYSRQELSTHWGYPGFSLGSR